jgi:signal transduction histidine kinase
MCRLIDKNIEDVRGMAIRLRPGVLDDLGLVAALEWYTTDIERRSEILCSFDHHDIPPIGEAVATAAYRIAQEALTNAVRHAGASKVSVVLQTVGQRLQLTVRDDGRGFDIGTVSESEGIGLAGMRERANLVGGRLRVRSTPGQGTEVCLEVPLPAYREEAA